MFKRSIYRYFGVFVGMCLAILASAQTTPTVNYTLLPGGNNLPVTDPIVVCPSLLPGSPSTSTFRLSPELLDVGDLADNEFEWAVYGGTIIASSGVVVEAIATTELPALSGYNFSSVRTSDIDGVTSDSWITVQWDTQDLVGAWVAVRQNSEWGCTDDAWSVYTQDIFNDAPVFDVNFPNDIHIPYDSRSGFVLPDPITFTSDPDGCLNSLTYSYTIERPGGLLDLTGDETALDLTPDVLGVGENVVTWTVSDGMKQIVQSYSIWVEPELQILNVAWINPHCADNGVAMVTGVTDDAANPYTESIEYSFNGGTYWRAGDDSTGLAAGSYTVQARLVYQVDVDNSGAIDADESFVQTSASYTYTLTANAAGAVDDVPAEGVDAVVVPTSCQLTTDGEISLNPSAMTPQNNTVNFDGVDDYMLLNKAYAGTINAFSVAFWLKTSASSGVILSFDNSEYYHINLSNGRIQVKARSAADEIITVTVENLLYKVNDNAWHQVLVAYSANEYNIYIDGELAKNQIESGDPVIGKGTTRYGMIGCLSTSDTFSDNSGGSYFVGQLAEVGILDGAALSAANALTMYTSGISSIGLSDHWVLDDTPGNVSAAYSTVFTDYGNDVTTTNYGRLYGGGSLSSNNSPRLYSWSDDANELLNKQNNYIRSDLGVGSYTLNVKDIHGCGTVSETYDVTNGDADEPLILWNLAFDKVASQSDTVLSPYYAVDGLYSTNSATSSLSDPYLDISLAGNYSVRMIRVNANTAISDLYVMVSANAFTGLSVADDIATAGVTSQNIASISAGSSSSVNFNRYGRYVRLRIDGTSDLSIDEVEIFVDYSPPSTRNVYLTDDCTYTLTSDDAAIDAIYFDECGGVASLVHDVLSGSSTTLLDGTVSWNIGDTPSVNWTATDDNGLVNTLTTTYEVIDEVIPVFESDPFDGIATNMTYCFAQTFEFPIPDVTDNLHHCAPIQSINLYRDGWLAYTVDMDAPYDHTSPGLVPAIPSHMKPGDHTYEWEVIDFSGNTISATHTIHIEAQPLLRDVKVSPITCNGANNAVVYFAEYEAEPASTPTFILTPVGPGTVQTTTSIAFTPVPEATYKATMSVNGCQSNTYFEDIVIEDPDPLETNEDITDVVCYQYEDGAIDLYPSGGNEIYMMHLRTDGSATAGNYTALDTITTSVVVECWVFLDSMAVGGMNYNSDLFGVGSSYGFRMVNGQFSFYAGSATPATNTAPDIEAQERTWYHLTGEFYWNGVDNGFIRLYVDGGMVDEQTFVADPVIGSGNDVYFGYNGNGYLNGFVRNARIWNTMPTYLAENMTLIDPIIADGESLLADFPANESGGTTINNTISGASDATISNTYNRQIWTYYWLDPDGDFITFDKNISGKAAGTYTVSVLDALGCSDVFSIAIGTADDDAPTMQFYSDHARLTNPIGIGEPIVRYTSDISGGINVIDDCEYHPYNLEFDPVVDDGTCDEALVTLSYTLNATSEPWGVPAPVGGESSLNNIGISGIIKVDWTATDPNGNASSQTVTYYAVDDEAPTALVLADATVATNGSCLYTVPNGDVSLIPVLTDNCDNTMPGRLYNNLNNSDNLDGYEFDPDLSPFSITWTYVDKTFPDEAAPNSIQVTQVLTVEDQEPPVASCIGTLEVTLDGSGTYDLEDYELDNGSSDNCGNLAAIHLTRDVAYQVAAVTQSGTAQSICSGADTGTADKAVDGDFDMDCSATLTSSEVDPFWSVNLGSSHTLYGVNVYSGNVAALSGFWVLVSDDGNFSNTGDWVTPVFGSDVVYAEYFSGTVASGSSQFFDFGEAITGQYVRIQMNAPGGTQLNLAEVEVFGTTDPATATSITLGCDDVRYTPDADPSVQGTFEEANILLTAIDGGGNTASCLNTILVIDDEAPVPNPQDIVVNLDDSGEYILSADDVDNGSTDNCTIDYFLINDQPSYTVDCDLVGADVELTFTAVDIYGNRESTQFTISIFDELGPTLVIPAAPVDVALNSIGQFKLTRESILTDLVPGSYDNCGGEDGIITLVADLESITCTELGASTIHLTAMDLYGNITEDDVDVNVIDNIDPVARAKNITVGLTGVAQEITFAMIDNGSYDNCDIDPSLTEINGNTQAEGWPQTPACSGTSETVTLQVFDYSGNVSNVTSCVITYKDVVQILSFGVDCESPQQWTTQLDTEGNPASYSYEWECYGYVQDEEDTEIKGTNKGINFFDDDGIAGGESNTSLIANPYLTSGEANGNTWYRFSLTVSVPSCGTETTTMYQNINFFPGGGQPSNTVTYPTEDKCQNEVVTYDTEVASSTYEWTITNGSPASATSQSVDVTWSDALSTGVGYATCIVSKAGCIIEYEYPVNILTAPTPSISPTTLTVCPGDIVTYTVSGMTAEDSWTWTEPASGTIIDGGNPNQDFMTIEWASVITADAGYVSVNASNPTCTVSSSVGPIAIEDNEAPEFLTTTTDVVLENVANNCYANLVTLSVPTAQDWCNGVACSSGCYDITYTITGITEPTFTLSGTDLDFRTKKLDVGEYTVEWKVTDVANNEDTYTISIIVLDTEAPKFGSTLANLTLTADPASCERILGAGVRDADATDNCLAEASIAYEVSIDYGDDGVDVEYYYTQNAHVGYTYDSGITKVTITATDQAIDETGASAPNSRTVSFYITVRDETAPSISGLDNATVDNDNNLCYTAYVNVGLDLPDEVDEVADNCSNDTYLLANIQMANRSDGNDLITDDFEIGTTTITWRIYDENNNSSTYEQTVTVNDVQEPWFDAFSSDDVSISYCDANGYRLPIPTPNDNCGISNVATITYTVAGGIGLNYSNTIPRTNGAFNPNGDGYTNAIPNFFANVNPWSVANPDGTFFTVTWELEDEYGNTNSIAYTYNLHVQIEPVFDNLESVEMTCGGADDASILVTTNPTNISTYHYDRNFTPEFSFDNGNTWTTDAFKNGLGGGSYTVKMRVDGCVSTETRVKSISEPTPYTISVTGANVLCEEDEDGSTALTMGGGAAGQLLFAGTGYTVSDGDELDLTTSGSVGAWVYFSDLTDGTLMSKAGAYTLALSGGELVFTVGGSPVTTSGLSLQAEYWYYIIGTWDASGMDIWVAGSSEVSGAAPTASANTNSFTFGNFNGILRDVCVWDSNIGGAVPASPYTGIEANLVSLWLLDDGSGGSAYNSCQAKGVGSDATGADLWTTNNPQPGTYTWRKDGAYYSDLIELSNIGIGTYAVYFVDPYGCPDPDTDPLTDEVTIIATDDVPPVIQDLGNLDVDADAAFCSYTIDLVSESNALIPTIVDASGCNYEVTWTVITDYNLNVWTNTETYDGVSVMNNLLGAELGYDDENGINTVTVTTLQNSTVTSSETYTITVNDADDPVADGNFDGGLSLNLDEFGQVSLSAVDFNLASYDIYSCTDPDELEYLLWNGSSWEPSIGFDCDAVGTTLNLQFMVRDQAGRTNTDVRDADLEVLDVTKPVSNETSNQPIGPYCATFDAVGAVPAYAQLSTEILKLTNYDDNCGVTGIRYRLDHESYIDGDVGYTDIVDIVDFDPATMITFYEGETTVYFQILDGYNVMDEQAIFVVTVLPKPNPGGGSGIQ